MDFTLEIFWFLSLFMITTGDTKVELKLISYTNKGGILANGYCCDIFGQPPYSYCYTGDPCDFRFFLCLGRFHDNICDDAWMETSPFSPWTSPLVFGNNLGQDKGRAGSYIQNPFTFNFKPPWHRAQNLTVLVHDVDNPSIQLVEEFTNSLAVQPADSQANARQYTKRLYGKYRPQNSELQFSFKVYCAEHFYGQDCNTFCQDQDPLEFCDESGNTRCRSSGTLGHCPPPTTSSKTTTKSTTQMADHTSLKPSFTGTTVTENSDTVSHNSDNSRESSSTRQTSQQADHPTIKASFSSMPISHDCTSPITIETTTKAEDSTPKDFQTPLLVSSQSWSTHELPSASQKLSSHIPYLSPSSTTSRLELDKSTQLAESSGFQKSDTNILTSSTLVHATRHFSTVPTASSETVTPHMAIKLTKELSTLSLQNSYLPSTSIHKKSSYCLAKTSQ